MQPPGTWAASPSVIVRVGAPQGSRWKATLGGHGTLALAVENEIRIWLWLHNENLEDIKDKNPVALEREADTHRWLRQSQRFQDFGTKTQAFQKQVVVLQCCHSISTAVLYFGITGSNNRPPVFNKMAFFGLGILPQWLTNTWKQIRMQLHNYTKEKYTVVIGGYLCKQYI